MSSQQQTFASKMQELIDDHRDQVSDEFLRLAMKACKEAYDEPCDQASIIVELHQEIEVSNKEKLEILEVLYNVQQHALRKQKKYKSKIAELQKQLTTLD